MLSWIEKSSIEIGVKPGSLLQFNNSAQGKVALAFSPEANIERVLAQPLERTTPNTITDPERFREHLALVRKRGWATAANESAIGLNALAFPLFDEMGAVVGSVAIVDLFQFIEAEPTAEQISATMTICTITPWPSEPGSGGAASRRWSTNMPVTSVPTTALAPASMASRA